MSRYMLQIALLRSRSNCPVSRLHSRLYFILVCLLHHILRLVGLVKTEGEDVIVQERQVVRSNVKVSVDKSNVDGSVDDTVLWGVLEDGTVGLDSKSSVVTGDLDGRVSDVELVDEGKEGRGSGVDQATDRGVVAVVVRNSHAWVLPTELDSVTRLRKRGSVVGDGRVVAVNQKVRLVGHRQSREDRELDPWVLSRALDKVSGEQRPRHGLRDTGLEPHWHGVRA